MVQLMDTMFVDRLLHGTVTILDRFDLRSDIDTLNFPGAVHVLFEHENEEHVIIIIEPTVVMWVGDRYYELIWRWEHKNQDILTESFLSRLENYLSGKGWETSVPRPRRRTNWLFRNRGG